MQPAEFAQQLQQANQVGAVYAEVRRSKALSSIVHLVTVKDTEGETVDTEEFFGVPTSDEDADTSASDES
jgi:trigger factor